MGKRALLLSLGVFVVAGAVAVLAVNAADKKKPEKSEAARAEKSQPAAADEKKEKWAPAVEPKPLSDNTRRGLKWLAEHQLDSGAWGQGEESRQMGGGAKMAEVPSVADTCVATLALIRSGSTPSQGEYAKNSLRGVAFVCSQIEESDKESLYITDTRNTRVQGKLGPYIDTFMAALLLPEVQDKMPNPEGNQRVSAALDKVLAKMQKHQKQDGGWSDQGWAATLSQGIATKGLNRARQAGKDVSDKALNLAAEYSKEQFDQKSAKFSAAGSAGVELYSAAANYGGLADSANTDMQREADARKRLAEAKNDKDKEEAEAQLKSIEETREELKAAEQAVIAKLDDKDFIAGFGSNGGEEFLSYMNIGEGLVIKGGDEWKAWDKSISQNLDRIQNKDGSWTGHHCITGRTFCTSAALLVLMVDRAPAPLAGDMQRR